jgi:hypothetical protein
MSSSNDHSSSINHLRHGQRRSTLRRVSSDLARHVLQDDQLVHYIPPVTRGLQGLQLTDTTSNQSTLAIPPNGYGQIAADEGFVEQLKELVNGFLTQPGQRHPYNTIIRWTVDNGFVPDYSVVIYINQPSSMF